MCVSSCSPIHSWKIILPEGDVAQLSLKIDVKGSNKLVIIYRKTYSSHEVVIDGITVMLTYFISTLNPFLYCWKVKEVRQAVKQTIRQTLCFPWTQIYFPGGVRLVLTRRNLKGREKKIESNKHDFSASTVFQMLQCLPIYADKYQIKTQYHCLVF